MPAHVDILEEPERLRKPLLGSIALHASVFALLAFGALIRGRAPEIWGRPDAFGGGAIGVTAVKQIPLPSRHALPNPLANDTQSLVPQEPAKIEKTKPRPRVNAPDPDAIPIPSRKNDRPWQRPTSAYRPPIPERPNQVYSATGPALENPLIGQTGSGGIGVGSGSPFGNRFGYYVDLLRQRIGEKWNTGGLSRLQTVPRVIVTFVIRRDGSIRDLRIAQTSGNYLMDNSAQRAVYEASPFPPLPAGFEKNEAQIEFYFELKR